ncbi:unnamed protein product [Amoebophrya sp. A120]|nr:unnamed protein product [Amoebophrya sp. A120]|eukprot:GSA120T00010690001.1
MFFVPDEFELFSECETPPVLSSDEEEEEEDDNIVETEEPRLENVEPLVESATASIAATTAASDAVDNTTTLATSRTTGASSASSASSSAGTAQPPTSKYSRRKILEDERARATRLLAVGMQELRPTKKEEVNFTCSRCCYRFGVELEPDVEGSGSCSGSKGGKSDKVVGDADDVDLSPRAARKKQIAEQVRRQRILLATDSDDEDFFFSVGDDEDDESLLSEVLKVRRVRSFDLSSEISAPRSGDETDQVSAGVVPSSAGNLDITDRRRAWSNHGYVARNMYFGDPVVQEPRRGSFVGGGEADSDISDTKAADAHTNRPTPSCLHGPFCFACAFAMARLTLPFCSLCKEMLRVDTSFGRSIVNEVRRQRDLVDDAALRQREKLRRKIVRKRTSLAVASRETATAQPAAEKALSRRALPLLQASPMAVATLLAATASFAKSAAVFLQLDRLLCGLIQLFTDTDPTCHADVKLLLWRDLFVRLLLKRVLGLRVKPVQVNFASAREARRQVLTGDANSMNVSHDEQEGQASDSAKTLQATTSANTAVAAVANVQCELARAARQERIQRTTVAKLTRILSESCTTTGGNINSGLSPASTNQSNQQSGPAHLCARISQMLANRPGALDNLATNLYLFGADDEGTATSSRGPAPTSRKRSSAPGDRDKIHRKNKIFLSRMALHGVLSVFLCYGINNHCPESVVDFFVKDVTTRNRGAASTTLATKTATMPTPVEDPSSGPPDGSQFPRPATSASTTLHDEFVIETTNNLSLLSRLTEHYLPAKPLQAIINGGGTTTKKPPAPSAPQNRRKKNRRAEDVLFAQFVLYVLRPLLFLVCAFSLYLLVSWFVTAVLIDILYIGILQYCFYVYLSTDGGGTSSRGKKSSANGTKSKVSQTSNKWTLALVLAAPLVPFCLLAGRELMFRWPE